ncbi:MAG: hypothetical protein ACI9XU_002458 [Arenicella sp.]|jgi:hypothetical protein
MLSVPTLDLETFQERGVDVGEWPASANADLAPLSLILIAAYDEKLANGFV